MKSATAKFNRFSIVSAAVLAFIGFGAAAKAQAPAITTFSPSSGPVGTVVTLTGTNFNRDVNGNLWSGTIPYRVSFAMSGGTSDVVPTFVSATQIRATVPNGAVTAPIRLKQGFSVFSTSTANFTVTAPATGPQTGTLRVTNNTQYNLVSLIVNGSQVLAPGVQAAPGQSVQMTVTPGSFTMNCGVGFLTSNGGRDVWFNFTRTASVTAGFTSTVTLSRISIAQLLTLGSTVTNWQGMYFDNNGAPHGVTLQFSNTGRWRFFEGSTLRGEGVVSLVSWPNLSSSVTFSISSSLPNITISHPFGRFLFRNGPPSWPIIEYEKQDPFTQQPGPARRRHFWA
jgi:hypothetical protein